MRSLAFGLRNLSRCLTRAPKIFKSPRRSFYLYSPEPFHPIQGKEPKWTTAEEAMEIVTSGKLFTCLRFSICQSGELFACLSINWALYLNIAIESPIIVHVLTRLSGLVTLNKHLTRL